jgi:hypothetical protein
MYVVGDSTSTQNWRIEKRSLSDGSLVSGFGSGGVVTGATTSTTARAIAIDASNMYVAGSGSSTTEWRIEKRSLSDGSLVFATTSERGTTDVIAYGIAVDATSMYVAGDNQNNRWRIEKRSLLTGSLDASFGSGGAVTGISKTTLPYGLALASSSVYIAGNTTASDWHIENYMTVDGVTGWGLPLAPQNTATTSPRMGTPFRLRLLLHNNGSQIAASGLTTKLQYAERSGTCDSAFSGESYTDIATSTGVIRFYNNTTPSDATALNSTSTYDPTHSTDGIVLGAYGEQNTSTNPVALANGKDGLWDYALVDDSAPASTPYCFRVVKNNGDLLDNYSVIPEIQSRSLPGTPGTPTFSNVGTSTLTVSWTAATRADLYEVERAIPSPEIYFLAAFPTSSLSVNQTQLNPSSTYLYRVRATNEKGNGSYSASSSVRMLGGYAPSGTLASLIIDTAVTNGVAPNSLYWEGTMPASTSVKFQFAAATSSEGPWSYVAWNNSSNNCTSTSYYAPSGPDTPVEVKAVCHQNKRYVRYKILLESYASTTTPTVERVILNYAQ